jgi:hypothetical protein
MVERERETIIATDTGRRGGGGTLLAVVLLIVALVVLYMVFGDQLMSGGGTQDVKADIDVNLPSTGNGG